MSTTSTIDQLQALYFFMSRSQMSAIATGLVGEERAHVEDVVHQTAQTMSTMPKTDDTEGQGEEALVHLHYFTDGCDWYIIEKDREHEQCHAFGMANLGHGGELGSINIAEIVNTHPHAELDLFWTPKPVKECK